MYTVYSTSISYDSFLHAFQKVKATPLLLKPLFHHIPIYSLAVSTERPRFWTWPMSKSTWPTVQLWVFDDEFSDSIRDKNCWVSIHAWKPYTNSKKMLERWNKKLTSLFFWAKILTCAFPKLVIMIYLWFRKRAGFCSWRDLLGNIKCSTCCCCIHILAVGLVLNDPKWHLQIGHWRFTPFLVIPIPSMGLVHLPTWMVAFYSKCREIYQPHGSYGWCRFTALLSSMYICPSLLVLLAVLVLLSRTQPSGWGIKSGTGYTNIRNASMWCCAINPDWEVDGAFLQCVQSIVAPYLHFERELC